VLASSGFSIVTGPIRLLDDDDEKEEEEKKPARAIIIVDQSQNITTVKRSGQTRVLCVIVHDPLGYRVIDLAAVRYTFCV